MKFDLKPYTNILTILKQTMISVRAKKKTVLREFVVLKLNLDANEYFELINWQDTEITEPPLTADVPHVDIRSFVKTGEQPMIEFERFPCCCVHQINEYRLID